ncbi:MAG: hypothetical protein ACTS78_04435, partial [Arsenophonus sp. NC-WZS1-MAG3]
MLVQTRFVTNVLTSSRTSSMAMNAYLAVGQGSQNESLMSIMEYKGNDDPTVK